MKLTHSLVFMSLKRFIIDRPSAARGLNCNQQQRFTASAKIKQTTQLSTHGCYIVPSSTKTNCKCRFFPGYGRIWGLKKLSCAYVPIVSHAETLKLRHFYESGKTCGPWQGIYVLTSQRGNSPQ
jgi:hypothetical protein